MPGRGYDQLRTTQRFLDCFPNSTLELDQLALQLRAVAVGRDLNELDTGRLRGIVE
jgi:hypothetical protein